MGKTDPKVSTIGNTETDNNNKDTVKPKTKTKNYLVRSIKNFTVSLDFREKQLVFEPQQEHSLSQKQIDSEIFKNMKNYFAIKEVK